MKIPNKTTKQQRWQPITLGHNSRQKPPKLVHTKLVCNALTASQWGMPQRNQSWWLQWWQIILFKDLEEKSWPCILYTQHLQWIPPVVFDRFLALGSHLTPCTLHLAPYTLYLAPCTLVMGSACFGFGQHNGPGVPSRPREISHWHSLILGWC